MYQVYRTALWVLGEYSTTTDEIDQAFSAIKAEIGDLPLVRDQNEEEEKPEKEISVASPIPSRPTILADGTYATQSAFSVPKIPAPRGTIESKPNCRLHY